jgi:hypothetical protein
LQISAAVTVTVAMSSDAGAKSIANLIRSGFGDKTVCCRGLVFHKQVIAANQPCSFTALEGVHNMMLGRFNEGKATGPARFPLN